MNTPPTPREVVEAYRQGFARRVEEGTLRPLVLPYHFYSNIALGIYLSIRHTNRPNLYRARWILLVFIIWFQLKTLREVGSMSMAMSYAAGFISVYGIFMSLTWLVFTRPQFEAKRIERKHPRERSKKIVQENGHLATSSSREHGNSKKRYQNGGVDGTPASNHIENSVQDEYYWQAYPDDLRARQDWVHDLVTNLRGPGWNWAIPSLPPVPSFVKSGLGEPVDESSEKDTSYTGLKRYTSREQVFRTQMPRFIMGLFLLDIIKTVMMKDPYFIFGPNDYAIPKHIAWMHPLFRHMYRTFLAGAGVVVSLEMVFLIAPVLMCLVLGPSSFMGLRGEAWYYATSWGSGMMILNKGLAGLWGGWWHQIFRQMFSAPTNFLISKGYLDPKSPAKKFVASFFAFGISGCLHASGSISQYPPTHPLNPVLFFLLQGIGIFLQTSVSSLFAPYIKNVPRPIRQASNGLYVFVWGLSTGWLLADDFAAGGIWLYEPLPISILRGLGFGHKDEGWWCWQHIGVGWYKGRHWWESGIAL